MVEGDPLSNLRTDDFQRYADDDVVAFVALDGDAIVGKIGVHYTDLAVRGRLERCLIAADLFVQESHRNQAVGMMLLLAVLKAKQPFLAASVSGVAAAIYNRLPQFHRVDSSPVYMLGLRLPGVARLARLTAQAEQARGQRVSRARELTLFGSKLLSTRRLTTRSLGNLRVLNAEEAATRLDEVASKAESAVQIPWSRQELQAALGGHSSRHQAWVVEPSGDPGTPRLVNMYLWESDVGLWSGSDVRTVTVAGLTEVYPPVGDDRVATDIMALAAKRAREMGAMIFFVFAMTESLAQACQSEGLEHTFEKSIYICPNGAGEALARDLTDPEKWWCRARSEQQFVESYLEQSPAAPTNPLLI